MELGFSSGILHKTSCKPISLGALDLFLNLGCSAIELPARNYERIDQILQLPQDSLSAFSYTSLHLPAEMSYYDEGEMDDLVDLLYRCHDRFEFNTLVLHPDVIDDWEAIVNLDLPIAIENSDWRKDVFKEYDDLYDLFQRYPKFNMVLDINHCYTNDSSLESARRFYEEFKDRIVHVHLSGFSELHEPLFATRQDEIIAATPREYPIIIESVVSSIKEVEKEFLYIKNKI